MIDTDATKLPDLLPCPFCGERGGTIEDRSMMNIDPLFAVCCECDSRGACGTSELDAVDAWNRRAQAGRSEAPLTDDQVRKAWRDAGGTFYGPNVEHGDMVEAKLLPFLRSLLTAHKTDLPADGIAVESESHRGSVQIYPANALEIVQAASADSADWEPRS